MGGERIGWLGIWGYNRKDLLIDEVRLYGRELSKNLQVSNRTSGWTMMPLTHQEYK